MKNGLSKRTAKGSPDGPRYIYGKENINWSGPKRANNNDDISNFASDFSSNIDNKSNVGSFYSQMKNWGVNASHGEIIEDFDEVYKDFDEKIADLQDKMDQFIEDGSPEEILSFTQEIVNSQDYQNIITTKEYGRQQRDLYEEEYKKNSNNFKRYIDNGRTPFNTRQGEVNITEEDASMLYELCQKALDGHDKYKAYSLMSDEYKNIITQGLSSSLENIDTSDRILHFEGEKIGEMIAIADTEPGSLEWHEARQTGMGGSDVGRISSKQKKKFNEDGTFKVYEDEFYKKGLQEIWDSKLEPITDDQIVDQENMTEFTDASSRGHGQEEVIGYMTSIKINEKIMKSKKTWSRSDSSINMNYDMFLTSDGKIPDGNLEIKTATDPTKWGNEEDGIDAIPTDYRAQVLSGCLEGDFKRGAVAVLINEKDLKVYRFDMTDELIIEAKNNKEKAEKAYQAVVEARKTGNTEFNIEYFGEKKSNRSWLANKSRGLGKTILTPPKRFSKDGTLGAARTKYFQKIADLRGTNAHIVQNEFISLMPDDMSQWTPENMKHGLQSLYVNSGKDLKQRGILAGIDLECTSLSATRGHIIDVGISGIDMNSGEMSEIKIDKLYDIPSISKYHNGTGEEDVHHISIKDIEGKDQFKTPGNHSEIINGIIKNGGIVAAHNASYEKRFLRGHVKGFAEAELRGDIRVVDTMDIINYTMDNAPNNKMESFTTLNDVEYKDAHRALPDAEMMLKATYNFYDGKYGGEENLTNM